MKVMKRLGIWLEVTTLIIPGINDDDGELKDAANFVAEELGVDTPWHISRFFPDYKMTDVPPTPVETLDRAREIGLEAGLRYVYVGNVPGEVDTVCHKCGQILIRRLGYRILENRVQPKEIDNSIRLFYSLERCGSNMNKKSNIIKIVKEDILRILGEEKRRISLEILKEEIKVSLSFINEAIEELEREGLIKSRQIFLS